MNKLKVNLGTVQETLLITLWARAIEAGKANPILQDAKSAEILKQIDYDFSKLNTAKGSQVGVCLRGLVFDEWVAAFLQNNPDGVVVEIGSGLNTRFERVDNGKVHWFDLDLPDSIEIRKHFFTDTERRKVIATSILDPSWIEQVKAVSLHPIIFVAEGVLMYLSERQVKQVFTLLVEQFPGCYFAFDSMSHFMVENQKHHDAINFFSAKFQWGIKDIRECQTWDARYQLLEVKNFWDMHSQYYWRMGLLNSLLMMIPPFKDMYRLSLAKLG